jgi:hypothetical protein
VALGYNVLLSDPDIVVLKDPFPYFVDGPDLQIQNDASNGRNSGWYYVKSRLVTIRFFQHLARLLQHAHDSEQPNFNKALRLFESEMSIRVLDETNFPDGATYFDKLYQLKQKLTPVVVHNNWIRGAP